MSAEKGGYDRFMQKEIFEQPRAITDTIGTRVMESELGTSISNGIDLYAGANSTKVDRIYARWPAALRLLLVAWSAST